MAKGKGTPYVMLGEESGMILGFGRALKDKIKEMNEKGLKKYSKKLRRREVVKLKPVKKGGTKALANTK